MNWLPIHSSNNPQIHHFLLRACFKKSSSRRESALTPCRSRDFTMKLETTDVGCCGKTEFSNTLSVRRSQLRAATNFLEEQHQGQTYEA